MTNNMNNQGYTVLVVEDDEFLSRAMGDKLSREGFQVIKAFNGQEAVDALRQNKPDIMLLDLVMPVKNGFEVLEEVSQDEQLRQIPVIVLSNLGQDSDLQKAKALGATDFLVKSNFPIKSVLERIRFHLEKSDQ